MASYSESSSLSSLSIVADRFNPRSFAFDKISGAIITLVRTFFSAVGIGGRPRFAVAKKFSSSSLTSPSSPIYGLTVIAFPFTFVCFSQADNSNVVSTITPSNNTKRTINYPKGNEASFWVNLASILNGQCCIPIKKLNACKIKAARLKCFVSFVFIPFIFHIINIHTFNGGVNKYFAKEAS